MTKMLRRVIVTFACLLLMMSLGCVANQMGIKNVFKIEGTGATYAGRGAFGTIAGKNYLFVIMNSEGSKPGIPAGILVLDVSNPVKPIRLAYLQAPDNTRFLSGVELSGTTLLVSASTYLWLLDVSNPLAPKELSKLSSVMAINTTTSGNFVYVNDNNAKITIINFSNLSQLEIIGELPLPSLTGIEMTLSGSRLFVIAENKLNIIDISSPDSLKIISTYEHPYLFNIVVNGRYGYLAFGGNDGSGMLVLDLSNLSLPEEIANLKLSQQEISEQVFVSQSQAYLLTLKMYPNGIHALHKIDISDPHNPQDLGSIAIQSNWASAAFDLFYPYLYGYKGNLPEDPSIEIINVK